jgi:two-component system CheB/CheR fusion protein
VTGYGRAVDAQRALQAGFNAHLPKPVSMTALKKEIDRLRARK